MQIDNIIFPVYTLGINKRLALWLVGCPHGCRGCSNMELWSENPTKEIALESLFSLIETITKEDRVGGVTITGGEPFKQAHELSLLVTKFNDLGIKDILIYTGYTYEDLVSKNDPDINIVLQNIALLIDGKYIEELNDNQALRGSSNQKLIFLRPEYEVQYQELLTKPRKMQLTSGTQSIIAIGIPPIDYIDKVLIKKEGTVCENN